MVAGVHYSTDPDGGTHGSRLGHARMPVILNTADYDRWPDPSFVDSAVDRIRFIPDPSTFGRIARGFVGCLAAIRRGGAGLFHGQMKGKASVPDRRLGESEETDGGQRLWNLTSLDRGWAC
jgi:hypothetical protein